MCFTYNHGPFIEECIESVMAQDASFRVLLRIHDDCSTDNTFEIVESYAQQFPNAILASRSSIRSYPNLPRIENGLSSEFIAYLDGDDYWADPKKLEKQVAYMRSNPSVALSHHRVVRVREGKIVGSRDNSELHNRIFSGAEIRQGAALGIDRSSVMQRSFEVEGSADWPIVNFDEFLNVQASLHGGLGFVESINPSIYRFHEGNQFATQPVHVQMLAQATSFAVIARWLKEKGFEDDSRNFALRSARILLSPYPDLKARLNTNPAALSVRSLLRAIFRRVFPLVVGKSRLLSIHGRR